VLEPQRDEAPALASPAPNLKFNIGGLSIITNCKSFLLFPLHLITIQIIRKNCPKHFLYFVCIQRVGLVYSGIGAGAVGTASKCVPEAASI
jgi:hypothetical protein